MPDTAAKTPTFEQALSELERIVHELEDGKTGLEDSLARYEEGVGLLRRCYGQLRDAEQRIVELLGLDGDGQVVLKPFRHRASADAQISEKAPAGGDNAHRGHSLFEELSDSR